jgi:hypothetical protein
MSYGTIKVDTITFTDNSVDKSVSLSGLIQNPTFTGNITVTGTISGDVIRGGTTVSGATVTGTTANFVSGVFTTQISGATVTGTTASFTSGVFTNISGTTATITSGIIASGTAAAPSLAILADLDTGLFSPGANELAVATNGTGRVFVNASGNVGVGTPSPNDPLTIVSSGTANSIVSAFDATASRAYFQVGGTTNGLYTQIGTDTSTTFINDFFGNGIAFQLAASEKARIDSSGRLGIGTSAPTSTLHIQHAAQTAGYWEGKGLLIHEDATANQGIALYSRGGTEQYIASLADDANSYLIIGTRKSSSVNEVDAITIRGNGKVGVGTTTPLSNFVVSNSGAEGIELVVNQPDGANTVQYFNYNRSSATYQNVAYLAASHQWRIGNDEKARIDSSGRLLVGTASNTASNTATFQGNSAAATGGSIIQLRRGEANPGAFDLGTIQFADSAGGIAATILGSGDGTWGSNDYPGRLVFSTTADGASSPTERLRITSAGLVGIGTSSPVTGAQLTVAGSSLAVTGQNTAHSANSIRIGEEGSGAAQIRCYGPDASTNGSLTFKMSRSDGLNSLDVVIDSSGRLGVGTTSPRNTLDVNGGVILASGSNLSWGNVYGAGIPTIVGSSGTLQFYPNGSTSGESARIDSSGRLLVGTSSDSTTSLIQVETTANANRGISLTHNINSAAGSYLQFAKTRGSGNAIVSANDVLGSIIFGGADGTNVIKGAQVLAEVDGTPGSNDMPGRLVFSTTADGASSPTERMRITSGGDFYFNTTVTTKTTAGFRIENGGLPNVSRGTDGTFMQFYHTGSGSLIGNIVNVSGTATAYNTTSDYRLKENIAPLVGAINRINNLQVRRFNFIANPDHIVDGFIAHEAQAVVPECVTGEKDAVDGDGNPVYQGIDQSKLVPLLTAALQEAIAEIASLKDRVAALEGA